MKIKTAMNTAASIKEDCQPKSVKALIPNCCPVIEKNTITIAITNINVNTTKDKAHDSSRFSLNLHLRD